MQCVFVFTYILFCIGFIYFLCTIAASHMKLSISLFHYQMVAHKNTINN